MTRSNRLFRIFISSQGKAYELYARRVEASDIPGFVVVEELLFGEKSSVVVDPSEDALKKEFSGVRRLLVPFHAVARIDEVEKEGPGKVLALAGAPAEAGAVLLPPQPRPRKD